MGIPRMCGGDPEELEAERKRIKYSPHVRG